MNFFKHENKPMTHSDAEANDWENLKAVGFNGENAGSPEMAAVQSEMEAKRANEARQQRKIVFGLYYGNPIAALSRHDTWVKAEEAEAVIKGLKSGEISEGAKREFINAIQDPIQQVGADAMFVREISMQKHPSRILAWATGVGFNNYDKVAPQQIYDFLAKYPLPMDFEKDSAELLKQIKENNPPEKYEEYNNAMGNFKMGMYGKRQEYWESMKNLAELATGGDTGVLSAEFWDGVK